MMPFHFEQQPQLRPAVNFRVDMALYERISLYARAIACVVTVVVAIIMSLQPPPTPNPSLFAFNITMNEVKMLELVAADHDPTNLTVQYNFYVRMSVNQVGPRFEFKFSNKSVGVVIGEGEWEIRTAIFPLFPLDVESAPTSEIWTLRLDNTITDDLDMRRVKYLANQIHHNKAVLITFVVSGNDFRSRDFKARCPAHVQLFPYKPPTIDACDLVIGT